MSIVLSPVPAIPAERQMMLSQIDSKELAHELLTPKQYKCFSSLIGKESAWKDARNSESSARGIGQLLSSSYTNLGMKHSQIEAVQTIASLAYVGRKYGSSGPCGAWKHWQKHKWY